jgi:hypothetical protein
MIIIMVLLEAGYYKILKQMKKKIILGKEMSDNDVKYIESVLNNRSLNRNLQEGSYKRLYNKYKKKYLNLKNEKLN